MEVDRRKKKVLALQYQMALVSASMLKMMDIHVQNKIWKKNQNVMKISV